MSAHATTTGLEPGSPAVAGKETSSSPLYSPAKPKAATASPARRSSSLHPGSPETYSKSPSLPIRSPLKLHERFKTDTSRSDCPEAEECYQSAPDVEEQLPLLLPKHSPEKAGSSERYRRALDKRQEISPLLPAPSPKKAESPKRKREGFDGDEFPSSSPPEPPLPRLASPKRQRREQLQAKPLEIASTPENSPRRLDLDPEPQLFERDDEVIVIPDDDESEAEDSEDDELDILGDDNLLGRQASPTLSSPTRTIPNTQPSPRPDTQAVFKDPTQFIDFDIPDPDEGWDDEVGTELLPGEPDPNTQLIDSPPAIIIPETQPGLPDTQALLDSKTQMPDFDIAEPDGGWDTLDLMPSSPPSMPGQRSSPPLAPRAPSPDPEKLKAGLDAWIDSHLAAGYPLGDVIAALKATSNDLDLAKFVLRYMTRKGKGRIPSNEQGIWTEDDDEDLESPHARRIEKVQRKHGAELCDLRLAFLNAYR